MITAIWDYLFTRRVWKIIKEQPLLGETWEGVQGNVGTVYYLQDQFGNMKIIKLMT